MERNFRAIGSEGGSYRQWGRVSELLAHGTHARLRRRSTIVVVFCQFYARRYVRRNASANRRAPNGSLCCCFYVLECGTGQWAACLLLLSFAADASVVGTTLA